MISQLFTGSPRNTDSQIDFFCNCLDINSVTKGSQSITNKLTKKA